MSKNEVTSPGHKLGQMIGDWLECIFEKRLVAFANEHRNLYCDKKGLRPLVRGKKKKLTWLDSKGNKHDLDYVFEKNGSESKKGEPVGFIELCWRRYTKHSRNKAGEIEGSLVHLGLTYNTGTFLGAILVGEFTDGAINQMQSRNIVVLHIPYKVIVDTFLSKKINLDYPENAPDTLKYDLIEAINRLSQSQQEEIEITFLNKINADYQRFMQKLDVAISRKVEYVRVFPLFGNQLTFDTIASAIKEIEGFSTEPCIGGFQRFEVLVKFSNGDKVEATFKERQDAVSFLKQFL